MMVTSQLQVKECLKYIGVPQIVMSLSWFVIAVLLSVGLASSSVYAQSIGPHEDLRQRDLSGYNLLGYDLLYALFTSTNLQGANLHDANLHSAYLTYADLRYADLTGADLSYAILQNADLRYADLTGADLSYAILQNADLRDVILQNADLRYADLTGAELQNADLRDVILQNADLRYANLTGAELQNADLRFANLQNANLTGAELQNADLRFANLVKAAFSVDILSLAITDYVFVCDSVVGVSGLAVLVPCSPIDLIGSGLHVTNLQQDVDSFYMDSLDADLQDDVLSYSDISNDTSSNLGLDDNYGIPIVVTIEHDSLYLGCGDTDDCFNPGTVMVSSGEIVTWVNEDTLIHTVTTLAPHPDGVLDGFVNPGDQFEFTFYTPGEYPYHCNIHPWAVGSIIVS